MMKQSLFTAPTAHLRGEKGTDMKAGNSVSETKLTSTYLVEIRSRRNSK